MTERDELLQALAREYASLTGSRREVRLNDALQADLHLDSLTAQELLVALEDHFGVELMGDPRIANVRTAGDLVELVATAAALEGRE